MADIITELASKCGISPILDLSGQLRIGVVRVWPIWRGNEVARDVHPFVVIVYVQQEQQMC